MGEGKVGNPSVPDRTEKPSLVFLLAFFYFVISMVLRLQRALPLDAGVMVGRVAQG
jgi:hypothetical protein